MNEYNYAEPSECSCGEVHMDANVASVMTTADKMHRRPGRCLDLGPEVQEFLRELNVPYLEGRTTP